MLFSPPSSFTLYMPNSFLSRVSVWLVPVYESEVEYSVATGMSTSLFQSGLALSHAAYFA